VPIPVPPFWGSRVVEEVPLDEIFAFINGDCAGRGQWQVRKGKLSEEAYRAVLREKVAPVLARLKQQCKQENLLQPKVIYGYFPCQAEGMILSCTRMTANRESPVHLPRQAGDPTSVLQTILRRVPRTGGCCGFQLVTMGKVASEHSARLFASDNYAEIPVFHGLSVESAEALAEMCIKKRRADLGIAGKDAPDIRRLFSQDIRAPGIVSATGLPEPGGPDPVFSLLDGERIGVKLTDEFSLEPEQSTNAIIVHHPAAAIQHPLGYIAIGK